jgi:S1-C subfamily serine protease
MIGDLLISFGAQPITRVEDVHAQLAAEAIGKPVVVKLVRGGSAQEATIVIVERAHGGK